MASGGAPRPARVAFHATIGLEEVPVGVPGVQALHCLGVLIGLRDAATQVSDAETAALLQLAASADTVVELGVFEGVTTRKMIGRMPSGSSVYCIDPFIPGRLGAPYGYWITKSQIRRADRPDITCRIVRKYSFDAVGDVDTEADLVFIDADHQYESVRRDWLDWSPIVKIDGHVALHDSQPVEGRCRATAGPVRLVRELGSSPEGFSFEGSVETLSIYRRVR